MPRYGLLWALMLVPGLAGATEPPSKPEAPQQEKKIDPEADRLLHQMSDYLSGLKNFELRSSTVDEVVTTDGRKIQVTGDHDVLVARPNRLRSAQVGAVNGLAFYDDGRTMTLYCRATNTYATAPSPADIDATIETLHKQYQLDAPAADLLLSRPYNILTEQVTGGQVIGKETVDGVLANHLAFQGEDVDWQIWIQDGPKPLPLRYVIVSKTMTDKPEFTARLTQWQPQARLADSLFQFQVPARATKASSFPISCGPAH